jgi:hypothetical protein
MGHTHGEMIRQHYGCIEPEHRQCYASFLSKRVIYQQQPNIVLYDFSGLRLKQDGMSWFGEGKLLGKSYLLKAVYPPESAKQLSSTPALCPLPSPDSRY